ncbi:hypothetical protein [Microterricola viridarii]|uniref:Uncharacterized protein n=1 Tax=Microterricola viridarii TaxID=412690 RepID=A0A1H1T5Q5_9MICO|nr:hypothetical protein [Microterricola viridarii]SDS55520.1 hypothetical protein SAMN04489834_1695 [Microterricola viridarii]
MRRTKSQIRAEQIAKLHAEQEAYDRRVKESVKTAAFARCAAAEELYEMLRIEPEKPATREGKNGPVQVSTDKDETKRSARLVEAVALLVGERDLRAAGSQQRPQAATALGAASTASGQTTGFRPIG